MHIYKKIVFLFILFLSINQIVLAQLNRDDWSQVKVETLSDAQVKNIQNYLEQNNVSGASAEQLALSKGMPMDEWIKLKARLSQSSGKQGTPNNASTASAPVERSVVKSDYKAADKAPNSDVFGASFFNSESLSFEPNLRIGTPLNYTLGPDDELSINVSGYQETNLQASVAPEGTIFIPQIGSINVNGLTIDKATSLIRARMSQGAYPSLSNGLSKLSVTLGKIRSIHITIVGAAKPGNYTVSSLSTVFNSLYLCGGPGELNTYRDIELIRNNKVYQKIDIYQFLTRGNQTGNVLLKENDVINFPVYRKHVSITGEVKRQGTFELKDNETLENLLFFAGGYSDKAYKASIKVKQITDVERRIKDIPKAGIATYVPFNGDQFQVDAVLDRFENAVTISGAVYRPGQFELTPGITLSSLIKRAGGLMENVFTERAILSRSYPNGKKENITFNVTDILNGTAADIPLIKQDSVKIAAATQFISDYKVQILGEVRKPGEYQYRENLSLKDMFFLADGFTDASSSYHVEVSRRLVAEFVSKSTDSLAKVFDINTTKGLEIENEKFILRPYDIITVRRNPGYTEQQRATISGEVNFPGTYTIQSRKEHVSDLLKRAGGVTPQAYNGGVFLQRKDLNNKDQTDIVSSVQSSIKDTSTKVIADVNRQNVRIAVDLKKVLQEPGSIQDYVLEDGDEIQVLKVDPLIKLNGEVLISTKTGYVKGKSLRYYLAQAGGTTDNAKRSKIYVIYPNGHIKKTHNGFFGMFRSYPNIETGSEIIVPRKLDRKGITTTEAIGFTSAFVSLISLIIVTISALK